MTRFQKIATAASIALAVLIIVGAIVRVTGAGMGCPDWPRCWGCLIPPTSADQIDPAKLDIEKYKRKAEQYGIDPATITIESLIANYNPVHTWTEFINRLTSLPLGILTLITFITSFWQMKKRPSVFIASITALVLLLLNAWMGANVVSSGLRPGVITIHMALAVLMLCVLVYIAWRGRDIPWRLPAECRDGGLRKIAIVLFGLVLIEGVLGSQIREKTDELKKTHPNESRVEWIEELEKSPTYFIHRSGSWLILLVSGIFYFKARSIKTGAKNLERGVFGVIIAQMLLGLFLAQVGIFPLVQVLHVGLSSILVACILLWLLASSELRLSERPTLS